MDNLTHGLLGAAIGMQRKRDGGPEHDAPLSHTDKAVVWASFVAGELPDIDVFFGGSGPMDEYKYHRGFTHSVLFAPVVAAIATAGVKLVWREAKVKTVYAWSLASVIFAHLINDLFTGWGTRVLWPFSEVRLGLDWIPIVDLLYTLPLLAAVIAATRKPHLRRKAIAAVLTYLAVYCIGYRGISHTLVKRAVEQAYAGQPVQKIRVAPDMFNPARWQFTVDLPDRFEQGGAYPFGAIRAGQVTAKAPDDPVTRAVRGAPELKPFFDQFAYAHITYTRRAGGYDVSVGDVRYRMAGRGMSYTIHLSDALQVIHIQSGGW